MKSPNWVRYYCWWTVQWASFRKPQGNWSTIVFGAVQTHSTALTAQIPNLSLTISM